MHEDHVAGRGANPGPAREDRRQNSADPAPSPDEPTYINDPALVALIDRASELDRAWFERHPGRAYRIRPEIAGEHLDAVCPRDRLAMTLVKQVRPGLRMRAPLWATRRPCSCDACLEQIWERITPAGFRDVLVTMAAVAMREWQA
jgi:hypothetical protein